MNEKKIRMEFVAFYDYSGIQAKLENMAAKGWMLEKIGTYFWHYRHIEPQKLHFAVTYLPKLSRFDPENSQEQLEMEEYCKRDGWKLAARNIQMQIFYHEGEEPVPIETDAVTQIDAIHRTMCRNALLSHVILSLFCIFQLAMLAVQFTTNPIDFLSEPLQLYMLPAWIIFLIAMLYEIGTYLCWYRNAKKAAENGVFLTTRSNQQFILCSFTLFIFLFIYSISSDVGFVLLFYVGTIFLTIWICNIIANQMQKHNVSRRINRGITIALCVFLSFATISGMIWYTLHGVSKPIRYYNIDGWNMEVFDAPLPLYIQDLVQTTQKDWSTHAQRSETLLVSNTDYYQRPLTQNPEVPGLSYTIINVKASFLSPFCKSALLTQYQDDVPDGQGVRHFEADDATPWHGQEAYKLYWGSESLNKYLLCYQDRFVEISFDWVPTAQQMAMVGQKLGI